MDALNDIAKANNGTATTSLSIPGVRGDRSALAELPLIGYAVDADGTRVRVQRFRRWLSANGPIVGMWVAALGGAFGSIQLTVVFSLANSAPS